MISGKREGAPLSSNRAGHFGEIAQKGEIAPIKLRTEDKTDKIRELIRKGANYVASAEMDEQDLEAEVDRILMQEWLSSLNPAYRNTSFEEFYLKLNKIVQINDSLQEHAIKVYRWLYERGITNHSPIADIGSGDGSLLFPYLAQKGHKSLYMAERNDAIYARAQENADFLNESGGELNLYNMEALDFLENMGNNDIFFHAVIFHMSLQNIPSFDHLNVIRKGLKRLHPQMNNSKLIFTLTGQRHYSPLFDQVYQSIENKLNAEDVFATYNTGVVADPERMKINLMRLPEVKEVEYFDFTEEETGDVLKACNHVLLFEVIPNR
jgi:hypothetical protein